MFKDIISRDAGEPWGNTGMTSAKWLHIPTQTVTISDLIATQPGLKLHALIADTEPIGGDKQPHVIQWQGQQYLEDGHHRIMRAVINGERTTTARVLTIGEHSE